MYISFAKQVLNAMTLFYYLNGSNRYEKDLGALPSLCLTKKEFDFLVTSHFYLVTFENVRNQKD